MKLTTTIFALGFIILSTVAAGVVDTHTPKMVEKTPRMEAIEKKFSADMVMVMNDHWVFTKKCSDLMFDVIVFIVPKNGTDHDVAVALASSLYAEIYCDEAVKRARAQYQAQAGTVYQ